MGETVKKITNKQLEEKVERELDKCQALADKYYPLLGEDLADSFTLIKMTVGILSRQTS